MIEVLNPACTACGVQTVAAPCSDCGGMVVRMCAGCKLDKLVTEAHDAALEKGARILDELLRDNVHPAWLGSAAARPTVVECSARIRALKVVQS
jgi:hypothetical protein